MGVWVPKNAAMLVLVGPGSAMDWVMSMRSLASQHQQWCNGVWKGGCEAALVPAAYVFFFLIYVWLWWKVNMKWKSHMNRWLHGITCTVQKWPHVIIGRCNLRAQVTTCHGATCLHAHIHSGHMAIQPEVSPTCIGSKCKQHSSAVIWLLTALVQIEKARVWIQNWHMVYL